MTSRRSVPCSRCRAIYTFHGVCENCSGSGAEELPPAEDRWADYRAESYVATTPKRQAPPPVMPQVGRHVRATPPTLDDTIRIGETIGEVLGISVDRHAAITKLIGFVTAEGTTDSAVAALLSEAERLRGAA